jgi:hypothetical protein
MNVAQTFIRLVPRVKAAGIADYLGLYGKRRQYGAAIESIPFNNPDLSRLSHFSEP